MTSPEGRLRRCQSAPAKSAETPPRSRRGAIETMPLGIVLERRLSARPWDDQAWRLVGLMPNATIDIPWRVVGRGDGWVRYDAGVVPLALSPRETDRYRQNLASARPQVFVVLRHAGDGGKLEPFHATVCPYAAQAYLESGEDRVGGIDMPQAIRDWVEDYIVRHPPRPLGRRGVEWRAWRTTDSLT